MISKFRDETKRNISFVRNDFDPFRASNSSSDKHSSVRVDARNIAIAALFYHGLLRFIEHDMVYSLQESFVEAKY